MSQGAVAKVSVCAILISLCIKPLGVDGVARVRSEASAPSNPANFIQQEQEAKILRLRGGWARGQTKQRLVGLQIGREVARENRPRTTSMRPCSGPYSISAVERYHGVEVVRQSLWQASPRSRLHDPRTAVLRMGCRMDRWEDNSPFKFAPSNSSDIILLRAAHRGLFQYFKPLIDIGADINHRGKRWEGCPGNLVGLTPLEAAAHRGHVDSVIALLGLGASSQPGPDRPTEAGGEEFWMDVAQTMARRRRQVAKVEEVKSRPYMGQGRRSPGNRKTRHAKGARGGVR